MSVSPLEIYNHVFEFCVRLGLIDRLRDSLKISEEASYAQKDIPKDGLDVLDAVHCLYDKRRTIFFLKEIEKCVRPGYFVIEAGVGTGILSLFAGLRGAEVVGYEINKATLQLAEQVKQYLIEKYDRALPVLFELADATKVVSQRLADVIISENIYTGMFFEQQVQIANNLIALKKQQTVFIPQTLRSYIILCDGKSLRNNSAQQLLVHSQEREAKFPVTFLSDSILYDAVDLTKSNGDQFSYSGSIVIKTPGQINGLLIYSEVAMPSGKIIGREDTTFLNSDIIITIKQPVDVRPGELVSVRISYRYGTDPKQAKINLEKMH